MGEKTFLVGNGNNLEERDKYGRLAFIGDFRNGNKYKGKVIQNGEIIFEGEYKEGKRFKGK